MSSNEITPAEKRMLEDLVQGFPELVRELHATMKRAQAIQQKLAAHASMFTAYGWPIPEVEGLKIQTSPMPPAAHAAFLQAAQHGERPADVELPPAPVQPAPNTPATMPAMRGTVRKLVRDVLQDRALGVQELRDEIWRKHGVRFGISSIYRILMDKNAFANTDGKWRLKR